MSKEVVLIHHTDDKIIDRAYRYFEENDFDITVKRPFNGDELGSVSEDLAGSVVYGGPFNVFEEDKHPFLHEENRWIVECMALDIPLLGICQGAQSIARVLGANCGPRPGTPREFGYFEVTPTEVAIAEDFLVEPTYFTESHFHEFDLPEGATLLAYSEIFPHQAFRYGDRVYAFQFHAECTVAGFSGWQQSPGRVFGRDGAQTLEEQNRLQSIVDPAQHDWFMNFMAKFFGQPPA